MTIHHRIFHLNFTKLLYSMIVYIFFSVMPIQFLFFPHNFSPENLKNNHQTSLGVVCYKTGT